VAAIFTAGGKVEIMANTIPAGTKVTWHYRSAIGHGSVVGIAKKGTTSATTKYRIKQTDHHPGEPPIVEHYGRVLTRVAKEPDEHHAAKKKPPARQGRQAHGPAAAARKTR
jgi:hypothetical protein